jgi:hypothetical protein
VVDTQFKAGKGGFVFPAKINEEVSLSLKNNWSVE